MSRKPARKTGSTGASKTSGSPERKSVQPRKSNIGPVDAIICGGLLLFLAVQTILTWRKWPDPLIDFGRELYVPWQIVEGAVLYRDIVHYYGPLGVHLNALLFGIFGVGFSTIIFFNLTLLAACTVGLYFLLRSMSERIAATLAVFLFLSAFAFGNYVGIGNYNFLSPYSHDTVFGVYLCLGMLAAFRAWMLTGRRLWIAVAGLAFGGAYLTKPEITVAAVAITGVAFLASFLLRGESGRLFDNNQLAASWALFALCAVIPVAAFNLWFVARIPGIDGWISIHSAWVAAFGTEELRNSLTNLTFMGMDNPAENLKRLATGSFVGLIAVAGLFFLGLLAGRCRKSSPGLSAMWAVLLFVFAGFLVLFLGRDFLQIGRFLVVSSALLVIFRAAMFWKSRTPTLAVSALWSVFGLALLLKMLLNPRIEHYGFFQAMPAMLDLTLFLIHDIPKLQGRFGGNARLARIASALLIFCVAAGLLRKAHVIWNLKTFPVASGADVIRAFDPRIVPTGAIVDALYKEIVLNHPDAKSLMVFPEGISLNYLVRKKSPTRLFEFVPPALAFYGQERLLQEMNKNPPDLIVLISRDIREFGSPVFGHDDASGKRLVDWMQAHYLPAAHAGGDPLNPTEAGAQLLRKKDEGN
jgi:4-amino-4-deoxy-L-arabinose transferase-like glycosyltransferase